MRSRFLSCFATLTLLLGLPVGAADTAKTTLMIKGMTCGGCVAAVKLQLKRTEGVASYEVSLAKGEAVVSYDPAKTDPKRIAASVSQTGFEATIKADGKQGTGPPSQGTLHVARPAPRT